MLQNFNSEDFLSQHWQKSPCLIKNALKQTPAYISADELAGLSFEDEVESRIIRSDSHWQMLNGPFDENTFQQLPESHWTLLVQTVDYWLPEVNQLLQQFKFIPRWRFDDLMISYATDQGGVGPHYDNYDVFLIQAEGQRRWRVGKKGDITQTQTVINGLKHLADFEPVIDVVMQPGDILYIPPETPHWGESIGESIGYSVGYRAPQTKDLIALLANHLETADSQFFQDTDSQFFQDTDSQFFQDSYRTKANNSNELEPELFAWAKNELLKLANNETLIARLLGEFLSTSKIDTPVINSEIKNLSLNEIKQLKLIQGINSNWYLTSDHLQVNLEAESFILPKTCKPLIKQLLSGERVNLANYLKKNNPLDFYENLTKMINTGFFLVIK